MASVHQQLFHNAQERRYHQIVWTRLTLHLGTRLSDALPLPSNCVPSPRKQLHSQPGAGDLCINLEAQLPTASLCTLASIHQPQLFSIQHLGPATSTIQPLSAPSAYTHALNTTQPAISHHHTAVTQHVDPPRTLIFTLTHIMILNSSTLPYILESSTIPYILNSSTLPSILNSSTIPIILNALPGSHTIPHLYNLSLSNPATPPSLLTHDLAVKQYNTDYHTHTFQPHYHPHLIKSPPDC
jgi:hypothetical protein